MMPICKLFQSLIFPGQNLNLHVSHVAWSGLNLSGYYRSGGSVGVAGAGHRPGVGVLPYMGYIGICRCEGCGFLAVCSRIGYINQSVCV